MLATPTRPQELSPVGGPAGDLVGIRCRPCAQPPWPGAWGVVPTVTSKGAHYPSSARLCLEMDFPGPGGHGRGGRIQPPRPRPVREAMPRTPAHSSAPGDAVGEGVTASQAPHSSSGTRRWRPEGAGPVGPGRSRPAAGRRPGRRCMAGTSAPRANSRREVSPTALGRGASRATVRKRVPPAASQQQHRRDHDEVGDEHGGHPDDGGEQSFRGRRRPGSTGTG